MNVFVMFNKLDISQPAILCKKFTLHSTPQCYGKIKNINSLRIKQLQLQDHDRYGYERLTNQRQVPHYQMHATCEVC